MPDSEAERIAQGLTQVQAARLLMYGPETYAIAFSRAETRTLEDRGLVRWVPGCFGGIDYQITDLGRAVAAALREREDGR
jgi:hypothetical protein